MENTSPASGVDRLKQLMRKCRLLPIWRLALPLPLACRIVQVPFYKLLQAPAISQPPGFALSLFNYAYPQLHTLRLFSFTASSYAPSGGTNPRILPNIETRISAIPIDRFRNFCIVAHVDHGKSTLSDRLLEHTGTIAPGGGAKQILDKLDVERERGITVKAQTCTMLYHYKGEDYLIHLVDTPGHVDFRAEVSRSYASCGGALLLVDVGFLHS